MNQELPLPTEGAIEQETYAPRREVPVDRTARKRKAAEVDDESGSQGKRKTKVLSLSRCAADHHFSRVVCFKEGQAQSNVN